MNLPLPCVLLATLLAPAAPRDAENPSTAARFAALDTAPEAALGAVQLSARGGRVEFVGADGRVRLVAKGERLVTGGAAHLEAGAGAEVDIAWPALGSVRLAGPCVVEWDAPCSARAPGSAAPELAIRITSLSAAEFEMRAAVLALELPGGWRVSTRGSAFRCSSANGGRVQVAAHAGSALVVDGPRNSSALWPRRAVAAGTELTLDTGAPPTARIDRTHRALPWKHVAWPWSAHTAAAPLAETPALSPNSAAAPR